MKRDTFQCRVYYEDTDLAGIVYYANYLKYLERARSEAIYSLGLTNANLQKDHDTLIIVKSCNIEYKKPAKFEDELEIISSILSKTKTSEFDFNADKVSSINPNLANPGSVTKSIFFPSFLVTSSAVFLDSSAPKRMPGVVLNWKDFTAVI